LLSFIPRVLDADVDFFGAVAGGEETVPGPFADRLPEDVVRDLSPPGPAAPRALGRGGRRLCL